MSQNSPATSGPSRFLTVTLSLVAVLVLFVVGGIFLATRLLRHFAVQKSGGKVTVQTPIGAIHVDPSGRASPGLPVYPGARVDDEGKNVNFDFGDSANFEVRAAVYRTADSPDRVESWYAHHLSPDFVRHAAGEKVQIKKYGNTKADLDGVSFVSERDDNLRLVALGTSDSGTKIKLLRFGPREAQ